MFKRKGKLKEATEALLEAIEDEIDDTEKHLEKLKKEKAFLQKKLND